MPVMLTERRKFIIGFTVVLLALVAIILGLTLGLRTPAKRNGGSPPDATLAPSTVPPVTSSTWPPPRSGSAEGRYRYAAVSSDAAECSTIGVDILARLRGSAVDAAIATMACVGILNLHSTGVGGGHFMTIYDRPKGAPITADKVAKTIIARTTAPAFANENTFVNRSQLARKGGLSICVPGEVRGWHEAWKLFGRVPWKQLFQPIIKLCEEGHRVPASLSSAVNSRSYRNVIRRDPSLRELLVRPDGRLVRTGDIIKRPKMAETLRRIADDPLIFYNGSLAQDIVKEIQDNGGNITLEDVSSYRALVKDPLNITTEDGTVVLGPRPPSSGAIYTFILNILKGYNFSASDVSTTDRSILTYHRVVEAFKFAYAKRSALGDEDFLQPNITQLVHNLTSSKYGEVIRQKITDAMTQNVSYYGPAFSISQDDGTAHLSVLAPDGGAVAMTGTINLFFGSNIRGNKTGIFYNDDMDDFSIPGTRNAFGVPASPSNYIQPGKRPMSSMCPAIVVNKDGQVVHMNGGAGGTRITTGAAAVTMTNLWFGRSLVDAVDMSRLHHQLMPHRVEYEPDFPWEILEGLRKKGHAVRRRGGVGNFMAITNVCNLKRGPSNVTNCVHAVTDRRKPSMPDGF